MTKQVPRHRGPELSALRAPTIPYMTRGEAIEALVATDRAVATYPSLTVAFAQLPASARRHVYSYEAWAVCHKEVVPRTRMHMLRNDLEYRLRGQGVSPLLSTVIERRPIMTSPANATKETKATAEMVAEAIRKREAGTWSRGLFKKPFGWIGGEVPKPVYEEVIAYAKENQITVAQLLVLGANAYQVHEASKAKDRKAKASKDKVQKGDAQAPAQDDGPLIPDDVLDPPAA